MLDASMALLFLGYIYVVFYTIGLPGLCLEETEVYAAIHALLHELGVLGKTVVLAVLEDEHAALAEPALAKYEVGELGQSCECIGGVGKDEVERVMAFFDIAEYIGTKRDPTCLAQLFLDLVYKCVM